VVTEVAIGCLWPGVALRPDFEDGEVKMGLTIRYPPNRPFFFILPVDPESNNLHMLVNHDAVTSIEAVGNE
jgi:hypothetical protein